MLARLDYDGALRHPTDFTEEEAQRLVRRPIDRRRCDPDFQRVAVHPGKFGTSGVRLDIDAENGA